MLRHLVKAEQKGIPHEHHRAKAPGTKGNTAMLLEKALKAFPHGGQRPTLIICTISTIKDAAAVLPAKREAAKGTAHVQ